MSSPLANMAQEGMKLVFVGHGLDMDRDIIRVKIEIPIDLLLRIRDHEVHIDGEIGYGAELLDERYADRKVGYEMPIHHIESMNDIGSASSSMRISRSISMKFAERIEGAIRTVENMKPSFLSQEPSCFALRDRARTA